MSDTKRIAVTEVLPPLNQVVIDEAVGEIKRVCQKSSESILELANVVFKWSNNKDWNAIEQKLDAQKVIDDSLRKKLVRIGANAILMNRKNWEKLPIGYHHLYPLTQIEPKVLENLIQKQEVHQGMTVKASTQLKNKYRAKKPPAVRKNKILTFTIKIKVSANTKNIKSEMKNQVSALKKHLQTLDESVIVELS